MQLKLKFLAVFHDTNITTVIFGRYIFLQSLNSIGSHHIFSSKDQNLSKLLGMVRNRATKSDNLEICRECLAQNDNNPKKALKTLKNAFQRAGAGLPSKTLLSMLQREAVGALSLGEKTNLFKNNNMESKLPLIHSQRSLLGLQTEEKSSNRPTPTHRLKSGKGVWILNRLRGKVKDEKDNQDRFMQDIKASLGKGCAEQSKFQSYKSRTFNLENKRLSSKVIAHYSTPRSNGLLQKYRKVSVILIDDGKPVSTTYVGTDNNGKPVGENTLFRIGSLSKFITGLAVDRLVQDPTVNLDYNTRIIDLFSQSEVKKMFGEKGYDLATNITLQQLINQRTGIFNGGGNELNSKIDKLTSDELRAPVTSELLRHTKKTPIEFKEGLSPAKNKFNYSNINATLVGAMMERSTTQPFQEIMNQRIFEPLGLQSTNYHSPIERQKDNEDVPSYAPSFIKNEKGEFILNKKSGNPIQRTSFSNSNFFDPSSHIWTTPKDMSALFSKLNSDPSLTKTLRTQVSQGGNELNYVNFSICNGGSVIGHNGGRDDYGSVGFLDTNSRKAIIVLENDGVQNVDTGAASISALFGMNPYHGDPTQVIK